MIVVGGGALDAGPEVLALAEKIGAPVVAFRTGKGIVDARHPLSLTTVAGFKLWDSTDLLIGIGSRLEIPLARWAPVAGRAEDRPHRHRPGRASPAARRRADRGRRRRRRPGARRRGEEQGRPGAPRGDRAAKAAALAQVSKAQPQCGYLEVIREALPDDGIVVDELTQVAYIGWYGYPVYKPRTFISSGFSGTLGYGFPTALGVKVGNPDRPVVSITGDGGFLFGGSDLATAVQFGINLVTVVVNNASYGNVLRDQQRLLRGPPFRLGADQPRLRRLCQAFGVRGMAGRECRRFARRAARGDRRQCAGADRGGLRHHQGLSAVRVPSAQARLERNPMTNQKFIIEPHFRLQEWVAEEKGYFADEGLDYVFQEKIRVDRRQAARPAGQEVGRLPELRGRPHRRRELRLPLDGQRRGRRTATASCGPTSTRWRPPASSCPQDSPIRKPGGPRRRADLGRLPVGQPLRHDPGARAVPAARQINLSFGEGMLFKRLDNLLEGKTPGLDPVQRPLLPRRAAGLPQGHRHDLHDRLDGHRRHPTTRT